MILPYIVDDGHTAESNPLSLTSSSSSSYFPRADTSPRSFPQFISSQRIADIIDFESMLNPKNRQFDIEVEAEVEEDDTDTEITGKTTRTILPKSTTLILQLNEVKTAVTSDTTFGFRPDRHFNRNNVQNLAILASDPAETYGLAVLSVNTASGVVRGVQRGRSGLTRPISQYSVNEGSVRAGSNGRLKMGRSVEPSMDRNFTCGVEHKEHDHHTHVHDPLSNLFDRRSSRTTTTEKSAIDLPYQFQINIVIDVDEEFIQLQGGPANAVEYVNFLVSAANVITEHELDVHCELKRIPSAMQVFLPRTYYLTCRSFFSQ